MSKSGQMRLCALGFYLNVKICTVISSTTFSIIKLFVFMDQGTLVTDLLFSESFTYLRDASYRISRILILYFSPTCYFGDIRDLRSFGMSRTVDGWLFSEVSVYPIGSIFKNQVVQDCKLFTDVSGQNVRPILRHIVPKRR
jgi:hypothetical protein